MNPEIKIKFAFFPTTCVKCGAVDEANFVFAGPHLKQVCGHCRAYIKFFDKSLIPSVKEIKIKIWAMSGADLNKINMAKENILFAEKLTGLSEKVEYFKLWREIRKL